jgi:hypothetical protein
VVFRLLVCFLKEENQVTKSIFSIVVRIVWVVSAMSLISVSARAADVDLTVFGGMQHQGQLTLQSTPGTTSSFVTTFDPRTFGVFGGRLGHGKVVGGEHTLAYAPNFIQNGNGAFIYHSNFRLQAPLPVVTPYGTVGAGLIHTGGTSTTSFGTEFAINYGGGAKVMAGPIGVSLDVRGYTVPKATFSSFVQQRLTFVQVSAGVVFAFE